MPKMTPNINHHAKYFIDEQSAIENALSLACYRPQDHSEVQRETFRALIGILEADDEIYASILRTRRVYRGRTLSPEL